MIRVNFPVTVEINSEFNQFLPPFMDSCIDYEATIPDDANIYEIVDCLVTAMKGMGFDHVQIANGFKNYIINLVESGYLEEEGWDAL